MFACSNIAESIEEDEFSAVGKLGLDSSSDNESYEDKNSKDSPRKPLKMFWHANKIDVVQELVPEQIRWFYKEDPKGKWIPFIGYDTLRIECRFRALEYSRRRSNSLTEEEIDTKIHVRGGLYEIDIINSLVHPVYWKGNSLPIMRGTWFVDGSWQPLDVEYTVQLEIEHLAKFMGRKIPDPNEEHKAYTREVLHNVKFHDFHMEWYHVDEVYMFSESRSSRVYRYVTNKFIQKSGTGTRINRGYHEEAKMDDKPSDVTHLVFVIHGIGQKWNQNKIITCCNDLRNGSAKLIPKYFPDMLNSRDRVEFLPVEWRTDLQLDGDLVESITPEKLRNLRVILNSTAMDILYYTSPLYRAEIISGLEEELNRLYTMFCERHPYFEANNGKVSICAHSLGVVIMYDILTGWDPIELYDQYVSNVIKKKSGSLVSTTTSDSVLSGRQRSKALHDFYIQSIIHKQVSTLPFKVENMFALGSPLGVFLTLRGIRPTPEGLLDNLLPKALCKRLFNIYHPNDPIAYRLEPLVLKHYSTISPLRIHKPHEANKTPYSDMKARAIKPLSSPKDVDNSGVNPRSRSPTFDDGNSESTKSDVESSESSKFKPLTASKSDHAYYFKKDAISGAVKGFFSRFTVRANDSDHNRLATELNDANDERFDEMSSQSDITDETTENTDLDLEYRLDYVLPSGKMNSYIGALFSHTSYWSSSEVAMFLLTQMFPRHGPIK